MKINSLLIILLTTFLSCSPYKDYSGVYASISGRTGIRKEYDVKFKKDSIIISEFGFRIIEKGNRKIKTKDDLLTPQKLAFELHNDTLIIHKHIDSNATISFKLTFKKLIVTEIINDTLHKHSYTKLKRFSNQKTF